MLLHFLGIFEPLKCIMSFHFHAGSLSGVLSTRVKEQLQKAMDDALAQYPPLSTYVHRLEVESFSFGAVPPYVEVLAIEDGRDDIFTANSGNAHSAAADAPVAKPDDLPGPNALLAHEYLGEDGLFLRLRCSYGGDMHCRIRCVLSYSSKIENKLTVGISLPIACEFQNLNMHFQLLCNVKSGRLQAAFEALPSTILCSTGSAASMHQDFISDEIPQKIAPNIHFDLNVRVGSTPAERLEEDEDMSPLPGAQPYAERFAIQFSPVRNAYRRFRAALFYPEMGRLAQVKHVFQRGFGNMQKIPTAVQKSLVGGLRSVARVDAQCAGTYVDEVVVAAFVRDRLKLWIEEHMLEPKCVDISL